MFNYSSYVSNNSSRTPILCVWCCFWTIICYYSFLYISRISFLRECICYNCLSRFYRKCNKNYQYRHHCFWNELRTNPHDTYLTLCASCLRSHKFIISRHIWCYDRHEKPTLPPCVKISRAILNGSLRHNE